MSADNDRAVLRGLAARVAEIAALPAQEEKRGLWRALNGLKPARPMVMIDQICWNELEADPALTLLCDDAECRAYERTFRRTLYQWERFPVDMVVEPFARVDRAIANSGFGIAVKEETRATDAANDVVSHSFVNQFRSMEDVERVKTPVLTHDAAETARRLERANALFGDILPPRPYGLDPYLSIWDPISQWMGVEGVLYAMIDAPDMLHALAKRVSDGYVAMLDQAEAQGLLCHHQSLIHCTGAYTDELPAPGFDPDMPRTKDIWMFGLAQMFSTVSPAMFEEYELAYSMPLFERFGLVYYGCCDPLHDRMAQVRKIPNARKLSMSPWADQEIGAREIGGDYVFSRKPNPAYLAMDAFDEALIEDDLRRTRDICRANGCPLEMILKDISTLRYEPRRLDRWAAIAMRVAMEG